MNNMTYIPSPISTEDIELSPALLDLTEQIAANVHDVWAANRIDDGWKYGKERNDALKHHPCLVPYDKLSETEKEYDRNTAMQTLKLIQKLGFKISN
ncbi:MAG: RyR domain-containing protein [Marinilabiliaceae bacterium]|nr:RyR domain-containing protein [Marinilabiliaceae bacterium]